MRVDHVVVIGLMGAGKSTVAQLVAEATGRVLLDNDVALARAAGTTARELAERDGIAALRRLEGQVFRKMLDHSSPAVIAAAASLVLTAVPAMLRGHLVVYLHCAEAVRASRLASSDHRPLADPSPADVEDRIARSRALADLEIDSATTDPTSISQLIIAALA